MSEANQSNCHPTVATCRYLHFEYFVPATCAKLSSYLSDQGAEAVLLRLPCTARSVSVTRRHVYEALKSWQVGPLATDRLVLVVSELVTNAVQHSTIPTPSPQKGSRAYFEMAIFFLVDHVRVEVLDTSHSLPVRLTAHEYGETGRGLEIVKHCTRTWGAHRLCSGGKVVWCDVDVEESSDGGLLVQADGNGQCADPRVP